MKGIIWHHTGGTDADLLASTKHHNAEIINGSHKTRWPHFTSKSFKNATGEPYHTGYNAVFNWDTMEWDWTRAPGEETAAAIGFNRGYLHFCIPGNYDIGADEWDKRVEPYIYQLWQEMAARYPSLKIADNWPHRRVANKSCFGSSLPDDLIIKIITAHNVRAGLPVDRRTLQQNLLKRAYIEIAKRLLTMTGKRYSWKEQR